MEKKTAKRSISTTGDNGKQVMITINRWCYSEILPHCFLFLPNLKYHCKHDNIDSVTALFPTPIRRNTRKTTAKVNEEEKVMLMALNNCDEKSIRKFSETNRI